MIAFREGDLSARLPMDWEGLDARIAEEFNRAISDQQRIWRDLTRLSITVGREGRLRQRLPVQGMDGDWAAKVDSINTLLDDLVRPTTEISRTIGAVAKGDLGQSMELEVDGRTLKGEFLRSAKLVNAMIEQLSVFSSEVTRVAREVGTQGKLGGQAQVKGVSGVWRELTESVNQMAGNLTDQVRNIAEVTIAVANGDLSKKITVDVRGEILLLKDAINTMVDQLRAFASEVTRVAREVGTDGRLGGQAVVPGVAGTWKDLTDSVNAMATNLTTQVRNIAQVTTAVARGDLSRKITVDVKGEILELKETINTMVDQLNGFAAEVTRVAREVGTEGKLGGQAAVPGVAGTWKDLTDNVNSMANNLTGQVRNIAEVTTAVAQGDLSRKITVDVKGEILELKETINTMVDQLNGFASEVTRVAREVGTEGKLGGQAEVPGVAGTWKDLTDNVNFMASNLTGQVRNIAEVTTAVANGNLSKKITVDVRGEILELKNTINTMVDQLNGFAAEVTRVAREVGTEGKLGGQAAVPGVAGTWKDLTDNVNSMANNLTGQVRNIAEVTIAVANGNLSKKITVDVRGEILELKETINTMVDQLRSFAAEVSRVAREVGTEGKLGGQAEVPGVAGTWKDLTDNVNSMASNLTGQVRNIADVATAIAGGDLNRKITVDVKGELLELKNTINTMVDQLNAFAGEVTRVAREVGTEGNLGGQAEVPGAGGTWRDLTDNVNFMASNLTEQVRGIVKVVTAVANGNLTQRLTVQAKGEVAALADTINNMTDTLAIFAEQVTNVAREVGVEGRLGGQANVPGASGTWKDLTGNVNLLAANLTSQVRAIAEVATAVTKGDLTRSIQVETRGEVAELKDNINTMISNLRETTSRNREEDWLKTNLARFTGMLQGQRELNTVGQILLSELSPLIKAHQGTIYHLHSGDGQRELQLLSSYAHRGAIIERLALGEGLAGQCALEKKPILLSDVPSEFITISSSLGEAKRISIIVLPVLFEGETKAVIELAALQPFSEADLAFLNQLTPTIGVVFNTIEATMRTEGLLTQSQQLTAELQSRQSELQVRNEELGTKARLLAEQNAEVERKNAEVEQARYALEEKAEELALTSKYKSEFLANMSHELRTPLNSILILSQQLAANASRSLSDREVEFSRNIHASGSDLLHLINDILDLSKIESGTVTVEVEEIAFSGLRDTIDRSFRHVAEAKRLPFYVDFASDLPHAIHSDPKRLQQILKNLLSNAVKFTASGHVTVRAELVSAGWSHDHPVLSKAEQVAAFSVEDTGIGIAPEKQKLIFEAFQQADAGTSRKFGGTGLGLAISKELAQLLGGEIKLTSNPGEGSTFTLFVPVRYFVPENHVDASSSAGGAMTAPRQLISLPKPRVEQFDDDRNDIAKGDPVFLIIEDDSHYAQILLGMAHERGFKGVVASMGSAGLALARQLRPTAISLDISLPDMLGWTVLNQLKVDPATRHIPVQIVTLEDERRHGLAHGALSYVVKGPTTDALEAAFDRVTQFLAPRKRRLLVIEDGSVDRQSVVDLLSHDDIEIGVATSGDALGALDDNPADCLVLDMRSWDNASLALLERVGRSPKWADVPVVALTDQALVAEEQAAIRAAARNLVVKDIQSPERLLDETSLFLHRVATDLPPEKQAMLRRLHTSNEVLKSRKVLVVDDDARNIFALTSLLENYEMEVLNSTNGRGAIEIVQNTPDLAIVLMDIMMPDMDGYETMRRVRAMPEHRTLPILALTAKAMKGDREKCLDAGASDYISKPVHSEQLLSLMRVWLFR